MPNLSQLKRERMLTFLEKIKDEHRDDDDMLIALGEIESELTSKKYGLVWEQHEEAVDVMMRDNIPVFTEVPEREITAAPGWGYNFILEGDNLHSLRLLEKTHKGKIDIIYIDPPYNRGGNDFRYEDTFVEKQDGFRHSKWLSFMESRLRIAWQLLKSDGIIFISIDDFEMGALRMLCDDVFGEAFFLCNIVWQKRYSRENREAIGDAHEYILVYAKDKLMHSIDAIKSSIGMAQNKVKTILERLFRKGGATARKLIALETAEFYAFVINNQHKLKEEFRDVTAEMAIQMSLGMNPKKSIFHIPEQDFYRYDPNVKNEVEYLSNAYHEYTSGFATSLVRSTCEMLFEQHCEGRQDIEWVYKNSKNVEWCLKAAAQGNASAQNMLGDCYYWGQYVPHDYGKAAEWYRKAADQGRASAQYNLGKCYHFGRGVLRNTIIAADYYLLAKKQGNANAEAAYSKLLTEASFFDRKKLAKHGHILT